MKTQPTGIIINRFVMMFFILVFINLTIAGQKSLFKAIEKGNLKVVSSYISKGIDPNASFTKTLFDASDNKKSFYSFVPLEYAVYFKQIEVVKLLMTSMENTDGYQKSINKAFGTSVSIGNQEITRLLLDAGADVNSQCQLCYERSAIQIALEYANFTLFNELLKRGARIDVSDRTGRTLLHSTSISGNISIAEKLLEANLDINTKDSLGATPVLFAAANGHLKLVKFFEEKGANLLVIENGGNGLLVNSVIGGNDTLVSYLVDKNLDVNIVNDENWTPLLYACYNNKLLMVKALIKGGADVNISNSDDEEPLLWALWNKNSEMARLLIDAGADLQVHDFRPIAKKNIKDKGFLKYFYEKHTAQNSEL